MYTYEGKGIANVGLGGREGKAKPLHTLQSLRERERKKPVSFQFHWQQESERLEEERAEFTHTSEKKGKGTRRRRRKRPKASALIVSLEASLLQAEKQGKDAGGRKRRPRVRKEGGKATAAREMLFFPTLFLSSPSAATATRVFEGSRKETKRKRREEGSLSL